MRNKKYFLSLFAAILVIAAGYGLAYALPYAPGQTLDPSCNPGDANCTVRGVIIDNGTVAGANATSSTVSFNIQGTGALNPFNVASSSGTSLLTVTSAGYFGVGTSTPNQPLTVYGNLSVATSSRPALFVNTAIGYVGIGTNNPSAPLEVRGMVSIWNDITSSVSGFPALKLGASGGDYASIGYGFNVTDTGGLYNYDSNSDIVSALQFLNGGFKFRTAPSGVSGNPITWSDVMSVLNNGNTGIGDTAPGAKLSVIGNTAIGYSSGQTGPANGLIVSGKTGISTTTPVANFQVANGTNATTTVEFGSGGQNKGTCIKLYRGDGSAIYASVAAGATTFTLSTSACATVTGF